MNAILTIRPYRLHGTWVFDDPGAGLEREPFVAGIPEMIDLLVRDIADAERGFKLLFSAGPFPGSQASMEWVREESGGNWYRWGEPDLEGWLCPALFKYFESAPRRLYVRAEAMKHSEELITVPRSQVEQLLALLEVGDVELATRMVRASLA
jgi:hypothetical protein